MEEHLIEWTAEWTAERGTPEPGANRKSDWLALFPEAASGELGRAFADPSQDPLWRETWTAPLHGFFEKPAFLGTEERFAARYREIEKHWG